MDYAFEPVPAQEAVDFIRRKAPLRKAQFEKLPRELQALAFTINGINAADALQEIRDTVAELPAGALFKDVQKKVAAKLQQYVGADQLELLEATPEEVKKQKQKLMARARGIIRQHGNQAYAVTAYQDLEENGDIFPYWKYLTVGDEHVRDTHRALNGLVLPKAHEFWKTHYPPWEYGCRCQVVPVTAREYERYKERDAGKELVDRDTLTDEESEQLTNERTLWRKIGGVPTKVDLRAPVEKMVENPYVFDPSTFQIPMESLRERYDAETWKHFEKFARGTQLPEGGSLWQWLNKGRKRPVKPKPLGKFPETLAGLQVVKKLGGSTGALMVKDEHGRPFVRKEGNSAAHLEEEHLADQLYRLLGVPVPEGRIYRGGDRPVKLAEFVHGQTLDKFLASATPEQREATLAKLREHFLTDALMGNWDVAGMGLDNILVDADGIPWRIDNGGALRFRAQGKRKEAAEFGAEVKELKSLLDAGTNPSTARVFAGISEAGLQKQWNALQEKRAELLAAAPEDLRPMLAARMDWLEKRFAPATFAPGFAKEVKRARLMGMTHLGDKDLVEDTTVLFWEEKNAAGQPITRAKLKLTQKGSDAIVARFGEVLQKTGAVASSGKRVQPGDVFWQDLTAALKHINYHEKDGQYNPGKSTAILDKVSSALDTFAQKHTTAADIAMVDHYRQMIEAAKQAMSAKGKTPWFEQYEPSSLAETEAPSKGGERRRRVDVKAEALTWKKKSKVEGIAQEEGGEVRKQAAYRLGEADGDGALHFIPWTEASGAASSAPYALRGYVEITIPGEVSNATLERAAALMADSGVDIAAAPPAFSELLYLRKGLELQSQGMQPSQRAAWKRIANDKAITEEQKVTKLKRWVEKTLKTPLGDSYQPKGRAAAGGQGWHYWERWDLTRADIEKEMSGYALTHKTGAPLDTLVDSLLNGGGQFTPTTERLRTGVPITEGMSPDADLQTGGANYIFTRITKRGHYRFSHGLAFKVGNLARMDSMSFIADRYGDVRPPAESTHGDYRKQRGTTLDDFRKFALHDENETILKWGIHVIDELDHIKTASAMERQAVLNVFKKHKITTLPDGRAIEDVVL
jgi:SPP1 gp7 family putative phage head morphogenesis protein